MDQGVNGLRRQDGGGNHSAPCHELQETQKQQATDAERVRNLEIWQKAQNGSLTSLGEKVDNLTKDMNARFWAVQMWLIGLLGGLVVALILLVANLVMMRKP